jgi:Tol biopolymer transport system component
LIVPTEGGPIQELARAVPTAPWLSRRTLAWSPDDRYVFYVQPVTDQSWELFRVPVTGGAGQSTGLKGRATPRNIQFSPDGKRISFEVAEMNELWAIDIPATKK